MQVKFMPTPEKYIKKKFNKIEINRHTERYNNNNIKLI